MSGPDLQPMSVGTLLEQALVTLARERGLSAEMSREYVYELARAGQLFLADAAAEIISGKRLTATLIRGSHGATTGGQTLR